MKRRPRFFLFTGVHNTTVTPLFLPASAGLFQLDGAWLRLGYAKDSFQDINMYSD